MSGVGRLEVRVMNWQTMIVKFTLVRSQHLLTNGDVMVATMYEAEVVAHTIVDENANRTTKTSHGWCIMAHYWLWDICHNTSWYTFVGVWNKFPNANSTWRPLNVGKLAELPNNATASVGEIEVGSGIQKCGKVGAPSELKIAKSGDQSPPLTPFIDSFVEGHNTVLAGALVNMMFRGKFWAVAISFVRDTWPMLPMAGVREPLCLVVAQRRFPCKSGVRGKIVAGTGSSFPKKKPHKPALLSKRSFLEKNSLSSMLCGVIITNSWALAYGNVLRNLLQLILIIEMKNNILMYF